MDITIKKIFQHPLLVQQPPVLVDIGASGEIHRKWRSFAQYAICVAFDADDRKMEHTVKEDKRFRKLIVINRIVNADGKPEQPFFLTQSPYCSSSLPPDQKAMDNWLFGPKFKLEKKLTLPAISLSNALEQAEISYIDWLKTDTQGTDLRLYKSLPEQVQEKILFAEFEPGIMDAYQGEDKLFSIVEYFNNKPYFAAELIIKGSDRVPKEYYQKLSPLKQQILAENHLKSPGWGELLYAIDPAKSNVLTLRNYLLLWVFAFTQKQYGYALEIALLAAKHYQEPLLIEMKNKATKKLNASSARIDLAAIEVLKRRWRKWFQ